MRRLTQGQRYQLEAEARAAASQALDWEVCAIVSERRGAAFEILAPRGMRGFFGRKLFAWIWLARLPRGTRWLLVRHMPADPFGPFLSRFVSRRITVHHAIEENYLPVVRAGWIGALAQRIERWCGARTVARADGVIGVTPEIASYQAARGGGVLPVHVMPNGINLADLPVADDRRQGKAHLILVASRFSRWKGLEEVLDLLEAQPEVALRLSVVGATSPAQRERIAASQRLRESVILHGTLEQNELRDLYASVDAGLTSFGMQAVSAGSSASLKVCEYLAVGLPVLASHPDARLARDFPFYRVMASGPELGSMVAHALAWREVGRSRVREAAAAHIDKTSIVMETADWCSKLDAKAGHALS